MPSGSFRPSTSKRGNEGSHWNTSGFHADPMKPPPWPGAGGALSLWTISGKSTEENGERSLGFSAPTTDARLGQSSGLAGTSACAVCG